MRISTSQAFQQAVSAMLDQQANLNKTQRQLATGERIMTPADDPAGSTQLLSLDQMLESTKQYQTNADTARSRLELEESALSGAADILQRVRELAVQGLNATQNSANRAAIAQEVRQRLGQLLSLANTKDANGEFIFSGYYKGSSDAFVDGGSGTYTYNGDQGQRLLQISPTSQVAIGDHGADVFMGIPASGGVQNMFRTLYDLATSLESNSPNGSSITDIDYALNNVSTVRARVGSRLNVIDSQKGLNDAFANQIEQTKSSVNGLDYAEAASRLNQQMLALQAAQQAFARVRELSLFKFI